MTTDFWIDRRTGIVRTYFYEINQVLNDLENDPHTITDASHHIVTNARTGATHDILAENKH